LKNFAARRTTLLLDRFFIERIPAGTNPLNRGQSIEYSSLICFFGHYATKRIGRCENYSSKYNCVIECL